jgi:hypothetical protein
MPDADLDELLRRPAVLAAVRELGVPALSLEDVLAALHGFGSVRITVDEHPEQPYVCLLAAGEEHGRGRTVLHAAVACWAGALESLVDYTEQGVEELERFLLGPDPA